MSSGSLYYQTVETSGATASVRWVTIEKKGVKIKKYDYPSTGPEESGRLGLPEFHDNRHVKMARLSAIHTGRLYPPPLRDEKCLLRGTNWAFK